jgi:DNA-binding transcriptional LysR family regulator
MDNKTMEMRQLRAFTAIAETGSFTASALRLHVTQAAISMQIKQLESELGVQLFVRAPRRVLLTEAGEILLERSRRILREHDSTVALMAELAGARRGRLRVGSASAMVSTDALPELLRRMRTPFPGAEVTVTSGTSDALVKHILAGELDIAFVSLPVDAQGIETIVLNEDELVAIASPRHKLAKKRVVTPQILAGEPLILGEQGGNTRRLIDQFFAAAGVTPTVVMELSRQAAIKRMVEEDMGVGIVPLQSAREELAKGRLVSWWIEDARINWSLGLAWLKDGYDTPIHKMFVQLSRQYFSEERAKYEQRRGQRPAQQRPRSDDAAARQKVEGR